MNHMDLLTGFVDLSKYDGVTSPDYRVFSLIENHSNKDYYLYLLQMGYINKIFYPLGQGSSEIGRWRLPTDAFKEFQAPFPPQKEQENIAKYIKSSLNKIDTLITKQKRLIELLKEKRQAMVDKALFHQKTESIRFDRAITQIFRPVHRKKSEIYVALGLYNRGRGLFHKQPKEENELGDSNFHWVEKDDLILSGQFAWEGSVALARESENNCIVSHRYPIIRGKNNILNTEYLWAFFTTKIGDFILNQHSVGSAGRNRPLNMNTLMKEKISIPPMEIQLEIAKIVKAEQNIKIKIEKAITLLQEKRTALISSVVTGKIDVRGI